MNRRQLQPYPGLRPFERHESRVFFGRQQQVDELLQRLKQQKFLAVLGASGSGKSSLVRAGLLPGLEKGYMGDIGSRWRIAELRPGDAPFERLAEALLANGGGFSLQVRASTPLSPRIMAAQASAPHSHRAVEVQASAPLSHRAVVSGDDAIDPLNMPPDRTLNIPPDRALSGVEGYTRGQQQFLAAQLRRGSRSLHTLLDQSPLKDGEKLLILVDQFEEVFRYRQKTGNRAAAFVALLLEASKHPDVFVVITMRSSFLGNTAAFHGLPEAINDGLYLTPRLTREELQQAIAFPARLFGGDVEEALVNQLVNEAGNNPDQLPLLQHALMRLWVKDDDKQLTLKEYRELNGLRGALDGHLNHVFKGLSVEQRRITEVLFRLLTERNAEGQVTRRPVKVAEVVAVANCQPSELEQVVTAFRGPGRHFLMTSTADLSMDTFIDISHESLIRQWRKLHDWVESEAVKVDAYTRLVDAAQRYADQKGELWYGTDLALGLEWRQAMKPDSVWADRYSTEGNEFDTALAFLAKSEEAKIRREKEQEAKQQAELMRVRKQYGLLLLGFVLMTALAIWGVVERGRAEEQTAVAVKEAERADQQAEMAKAETERAEEQKDIAEQTAKRADAETERARVAEEIRTWQLFDSDTTHASLLTQIEDFTGARKKLNKTRYLDDKVPAERRHARDLLAGFVDIMGGEAQRTFMDEGGKPLPQLSGNVAVSPDGKWLAASGERGTIALFERESRRLVQKLEGHNSVGLGSETTVWDIVFHPEQPWLFSAGADGKILWWRLPQEGEAAILLDGWSVDAGEANALALTPDGKVLASGHDDGGVRLWELEDSEHPHPNPSPSQGEGLKMERELVRVLEGHSRMIANGWGLAFSSEDGRWLASASYDETVRLWDWQSGEVKHVLRGHNLAVHGVAFSPNNQYLASSGQDQSIILWDVESGRGLRRIKGHQNMVFGHKFLDDDLLASASSDTTVRLWDVKTGVARRVLQGHTAAVGGLASYTEDGEMLLYSNSNDGTVKQWRGDLPGQWLVEFPESAISTAISHDGEKVAVGLKDGNIQLYDIRIREVINEVKEHSGQVLRLAFSDDDALLASASHDKKALLWKVTTDGIELKQTTSEHNNSVHSVTFSPDNTQLATASYDGKIGLFDLKSGEKTLFEAHDGWVASVNFDDSGKYLASAGIQDFSLKLWGAKGNPPKLIVSEKANDKLLWASLSPDGTQLASVGREQTITIHPTQGNTNPLHLHGHEQTVFKAIFSPDSRQLATVSSDMTVRLWDLDTESELFRLRLPTQREHGVPLWDFDFRCTPTGCWIAVPLTSGKLALYNLGKINYNDPKPEESPTNPE